MWVWVWLCLQWIFFPSLLHMHGFGSQIMNYFCCFCCWCVFLSDFACWNSTFFQPTCIFVQWPFYWDLLQCIDPSWTNETYEPSFIPICLSHSFTSEHEMPRIHQPINYSKVIFELRSFQKKMCKFKKTIPGTKHTAQLNKTEPNDR